jgi:SAM-dependent methyltransferase
MVRRGARGATMGDSSDRGDKGGLQASYDRIAPQYADAFFDELTRKPFDRELLDRFAERVGRRERGTTWDIGCGPGHVARYLHDRGVPVCGLDLSEQMVARAAALNPRIPFVIGTMLALPVPDATLAGIACFYAIIHLTRSEAAEALREFCRALRPGGCLLLSFHGGEGEVHADEWFGERVDVTATLFERDEMARYAREAGFDVLEQLERPPYAFEHQTRRVYLFAQKPE